MKVIILESAEKDVCMIREFLSEYGKKPTENFRTAVNQFYKNISRTPEMYPVYELNKNFRAAVLIYKYIAFYQINEAGNKITVHHVLHGKRNIPNVLK